MHALNNVLGMDLFTAETMSEACDNFLTENRFEGGQERRSNHETPLTGFYSEAVMTYALRFKQNLFVMDVDAPIRPDDAEDVQRIFADDTMVQLLTRTRHIG